MDKLLEKMEALNEEIKALEEQAKESDETEAKVIAKMIEAKTAKFEECQEEFDKAKKAKARQDALDAVKSKAKVRDWFIIHTAIFTGLRRAEICDLKVADLRIGNQQSHIIARTRKGGKKNQIVHIGRNYKRTLRKYLRWKMDNDELSPDAYLLRTERTEKYSPAGLWYRWRKHCPKKLHAARHTFATMTYQATKDLRLLQKQLSHSKITTTSIYADVTPEQICAGMDSMEKLTRAVCR